MYEKMILSARDTALEVLMQISKANAWSDGSLKHTIAKNKLDSRDAALATRICYGVIQNRILLDYYIDCWCTQRAEHLEPLVLNVLRIGAYQILFMDKIPEHAILNETVELVKRHGRPKAAGMVNAILRKFQANKEHMPEISGKSTAECLSIRYSHPKWLVERLVEILGEQECIEFLKQNNETVKTTIHVNTLLISEEKLVETLHAEGVVPEKHEWMKGCYQIAGTGNLEQLPSFNSGLFYVQDPAAHLVSEVLSPKEQDNILDVCSAPGGKSFATAIAMGDHGSIISCDIHPHKLKLIENGANRLHITSIQTCLADGREPHETWMKKADAVILDVPCSGLGIIRKKPDVRYKDEKELEQLPGIQLSILRNASGYVKPGGTLVYSTCTILPEENEGVVNQFLALNHNFALEPFSLEGPIGQTNGMLTLWPQRNQTDGFFICKMRRIGNN